MGRVAIIVFTLLSGLLQGCSATSAVENVVTGFTLETYTQGTDSWVQGVAQVNVGNFQLPAFNVPLADPAHMENSYGNLAFVPNQCSGQACQSTGNLVISINISKSASLPNTRPVLPNDTPIPVSGFEGAHGITIPVGDTGAKVYMALGPGVTLLGTAVPFSALDPAGQVAPGVNLFVPLSFNNVNITAGMFFGATPNTTGFGVFVDLSSIVKLSDELRKYGRTPNRVVLQSVMPTDAEKDRLGKILQELEKKKTPLRLKE